MRLDGRKVLVVGVGSGLGPATVYMLLKDGAQVVMAARTKEKLEGLKVVLSKYGSLDYAEGDASTAEGSAKIVKDAVLKMGRIDDLIILAGNYADTPIATIDDAGIDGMFEANLKAPFHTLKNALPHLKSGSSVVMVSSVLGTYAISSGNVAYSATKAGVAKSVEVLSNELASKGIRVNAVAPRSMRHDFAPERDWKSTRKLGDTDCPPEDVARVVVWLIADEASWVSGAVIPVDGGRKK